ncbi:MAG: sel1 repeat family protein [Kordiimonadaceae bacterium]|jgi:uncharacterized protein|nr:sel1 repeat family protein [Kordiimonadaceae bacterium]MBT6034846.1 sel1 repeat family protein [Kordiimonadaceae bacterium]MBT6328908.1 sel1 repeat family protein [Kordiimonadaceae bacterium]
MNFLPKTIFLITLLYGPFSYADIDGGKEAYFIGDYEKAHNELLPDANDGNSYAQIKIGFMYENGWGVAKDYTAARNWYQKAAKLNDPEGHVALAKLYAYAKGTSRDKALAERHLLKAAELGLNHAYYVLGDINNDDFAFGHNDKDALKYYLMASSHNAAARSRNGHYSKGSGIWFRLITGQGVTLTREAADNGNTHAQFNVALRYHFGEGVPRNFDLAENYFLLAAKSGIIEAQNFVGQNRAVKDGNNIDKIFVDKWFTIAAQGGNKDAMRNKQKIETSMTADEILTAEMQATNWGKERLP